MASPRPARTLLTSAGTRLRGQAKSDNDAQDWKYVAKGTCQSLGGKTEPPKKN
jgi:uncharacterized membrane protein